MTDNILNCIVETTNNCWVRCSSVPSKEIIHYDDGYPCCVPKGTKLLITGSDKHPTCPSLIGALILEGKPVPIYYSSYYVGHECKVITNNFFKKVKTIDGDKWNKDNFVISDYSVIIDMSETGITIFKPTKRKRF